MKEGQTNREPLTDLAYDWVTIIQHKSEALRAYQEYMRDAQQANSPECVQLMQQIYEQDARHVQEATQHLMKVLQGQQGQQGQGMGQQGQMGQTGGVSSQARSGQGESVRSSGQQGSGGQSTSGRIDPTSSRQGGGSRGA